jgi:pimeloyl-ACP methyl ester carboxylesterase
MQTVIDGILTEYQILNPKAKNTILVLHGWGQNASLWAPVCSRFNPNFRYIILSLPGFGQTQLLTPRGGVKEYSRFVRSFISKLKLHRPIIFGHSFGGQISAYLAIHHPQSLSAQILLSPAINRRKSFKQKVKILLYSQFGFLKSILPASIVKLLLSQITSTDYYNSSPLHQQVLKSIVNQDLTSSLPKISLPTYLIWGENDTEIPYSGTTIANLIPNCRLYLLHHADHNPHLLAPNTFVPVFNHITHLLP